MSKLTLIAAFRKTENSVGVMYFHKERRQEFVITWNNIDQGTGKALRYDLQVDCIGRSESLNRLIEDAINDGDCDLYLELRDTFDALDCESI